MSYFLPEYCRLILDIGDNHDLGVGGIAVLSFTLSLFVFHSLSYHLFFFVLLSPMFRLSFISNLWSWVSLASTRVCDKVSFHSRLYCIGWWDPHPRIRILNMLWVNWKLKGHKYSERERILPCVLTYALSALEVHFPGWRCDLKL